MRSLVAPHAGAWIETKHEVGRQAVAESRSPCGSVD